MWRRLWRLYGKGGEGGVDILVKDVWRQVWRQCSAVQWGRDISGISDENSANLGGGDGGGGICEHS